MDNRKICFIACVNNELMFEECKLYIERLYVPEGYEIDVLEVCDADSMTSGYNEAMHASDAKYKIYLHQDVFVVDRYFLYEMLEIFEYDNKIKMIGAVGTYEMPEDGIMWNSQRVFSIYGKNLSDIKDCDKRFSITGDNIQYVEAIDGLLMVTACDIDWREDIFKNFDFYDASQSMEFLKKGYRISVPTLGKPICVHDDGYILNLTNYEENRKIFLEEYGNFLKRH